MAPPTAPTFEDLMNLQHHKQSAQDEEIIGKMLDGTRAQ
jgi:hypothetical protein